MSEELVTSKGRSCSYRLPAIDIPSISIAMTMLNKEISNSLVNMQTASTNLEQAILSASLVTSRHEIADSLQSSNQTISKAMSEIQERMLFLEETLNENTITPISILTTDDISVAIHVAVKGPQINYHLATMALERFLHLWRMELKLVEIENINVFPNEVWTRTFLNNIVKLFKGGYGRELYESLHLLQSLTRNESELECTPALFDELSLILLQRNTLTVENEQRNWAYLILKNGEQKIDHGISRLINSFLFSSRKDTIINITSNALLTIRNFVGEIGQEGNKISLIEASNLPCALCKILIEEKENKALFHQTLGIISDIFEHKFNQNYVSMKWDFMDCFVQYGICEALISFIGEYKGETDHNEYSFLYAFNIINQLTSAQFTEDDTISRFVAAGLLNCLVTVYNSSTVSVFADPFLEIVFNLCDFDENFIHQFNLLGIPRNSYFFSNVLSYGLEDINMV